MQTQHPLCKIHISNIYHVISLIIHLCQAIVRITFSWVAEPYRPKRHCLADCKHFTCSFHILPYSVLRDLYLAIGWISQGHGICVDVRFNLINGRTDQKNWMFKWWKQDTVGLDRALIWALEVAGVSGHLWGFNFPIFKPHIFMGFGEKSFCRIKEKQWPRKI